ncbi:multidrug effflux MFS transporter [Pseudoponticoccus marisrubri]|uniref:Bcr/CflA family efflux transporter n=1 Tax=Pseudoponticoccus marisrubri TaxID=1685382 RepID=A0A0W7WM44_9RHOB|nr:multidrug effflux MFS transporter [Pseudoponticoccus marisrubri]KUF11626.1 multidrug MFS transporter [Pseudoponticoccus marisrubri]
MSRNPSTPEFIAVIAMLVATIAFSIDAMLPALPQLAAELSPDAPNDAQLVVTSFVLGMGIGTLFTGPLSDAFGRKPVVLVAAGVYIAAALAATQAADLDMLLGARFLQGLGAAGPRVVALAIVRDRHAGRGMARIMSFVMMVFTLIPAIAPSLGAVLIHVSGWQAVFWAFALFSALSALWLMLRVPETLDPAHRRPLQLRTLWEAIREMAGHPTVRLAILVQGLAFGMLFATISTIQPIYDVTFGRADSFPLWFGAIAIVAMSASYLNARLVMQLGMRRLVSAMLSAQVVLSGAMLVVLQTPLEGTALFLVFVAWQTTLFFQAGMILGNLNAIAMEPMGHIAGMAASITGSVATIIAVLLAAPVGLAFDGTPVPLAIAVFVFTVIGVALMRLMTRIEAALPA